MSSRLCGRPAEVPHKDVLLAAPRTLPEMAFAYLSTGPDGKTGFEKSTHLSMGAGGGIYL